MLCLWLREIFVLSLHLMFVFFSGKSNYRFNGKAWVVARGSFCRVLSIRTGLVKGVRDFGTPHIIYWLKLRDISKFPSLPDLTLNRCHLHEMQYKVLVFK